jgi:alanyl-tRNA synthetase
MRSSEVRKSFLDFFEQKGHRIVPGSPVIPHGDPTLLFTNAGMNQFKDVFLGTGKRDYLRAADTQKCIRVSGKHNDLEEVGKDTYHHTFFEMLGNWSFGDYYKAEAIQWAWELLTDVWGLEKDRLYATVYRTDDEAFELWKRFLPSDRILRFDEKDNFWEMGETGPCGPCSEIHYDKTSDKSGVRLVNKGTPDVIEIWNLVFIQYNRKSDGSLEELQAKHVDTGMGFERICAVIQGKDSNYETDIFMPLINELESLSSRKYSPILKDPDGIAMRVISDHIRTLSFAIADGAIPGNEGRGYVLRRILRRASRYARNLGFKEPVLYKLLDKLIEIMGDFFQELEKNRDIIQKVIKAEEESFLQTLDNGLEKFENILSNLKQNSLTVISGADAFQLYDTFGFPLDLTQILAEENGLTVDLKGFEEQMKAQKERSRKARKIHHQEVEFNIPELFTEFTGYNELTTEARVLYVDENKIIFDKTPFYVESGGQISDTGEFILAGEKYNVIDLKKVGDAIIHFTDKEIENLVGETALLTVDSYRRKKIMKNHSATHLLHEALRQVLGDHIKQAGSLVAPDYLRFDFNHFEKVKPSEIKKIEDIVNQKIFEAIDVETKVLPLQEAVKNPKTKMFFGDKYGDIVRVVVMDENYSMEFCGGTHVKNTSEIQLFKILSESSIAAGVRRVEAITGNTIINYLDNLLEKLNGKEVEINELTNKIRQLEKGISNLKLEELKNEMKNWVTQSKNEDDIRVIAKKVNAENIDELRMIGEELRNMLSKNGVGLLATQIEDKIQLVCVVTDDLNKKIPAGKIISESAKIIGGSGGGKPHLATAGGKDLSKLDELLAKFPEIVSSFVTR